MGGFKSEIKLKDQDTRREAEMAASYNPHFGRSAAVQFFPGPKSYAHRAPPGTAQGHPDRVY